MTQDEQWVAKWHRLYRDLPSQSVQAPHRRAPHAQQDQAQPKADECRGNERRKSEDVP